MLHSYALSFDLTECQCLRVHTEILIIGFLNQIYILGSIKKQFSRDVGDQTSLLLPHLMTHPFFLKLFMQGTVLKADMCWLMTPLTWTSEKIYIDLIYPLNSWGNWGPDIVTWDHLLLHNKVGNSKLSLLRQFRIRMTGSASRVAWEPNPTTSWASHVCPWFIRSWTRSVFAKWPVLDNY